MIINFLNPAKIYRRSLLRIVKLNFAARLKFNYLKYLSSGSNNHNTTSTSWIDSKYIHPYAKPYLKLARADKQVGTALLFWPCLWSIELATPAGNIPDPIIISKFLAGAIIMRSVGCIINDIWDKDFDKHVERTKIRPLASGELTLTEALLFLVGNLSAGLGILTSLDPACLKLGFSIMPLVIIYPLMKRITYFPQLVLGMTFNWGAFMGWTAVTGSFSLLHTLPLYISGICWTLVYDTLYGYQDKKDDTRLGFERLKSTSIYLGDSPQMPLTFISGGMFTGLVITGLTSELSYPFYMFTACSTGHILWQIWSADLKSSFNLWNRFDSNKYIGAVISLGILSGKLS